MKAVLVIILISLLSWSAAGDTFAPVRADFVIDSGFTPAQERVLGGAQGLSFFFWNVAFNSYSKERDAQGRTLVEANLAELNKLNNNSRFVVLSEVNVEKLRSQDELEKLVGPRLAASPCKAFLPYHKATKAGLIVLGAWRCEVENLGELDWAPDNISESQKKLYRKKWGKLSKMKEARKQFLVHPKRYVRDLSVINFESESGESFSLFPLHLHNPWRLLQVKRGLKSDPETTRLGLSAKASVGASIFFGLADNPLYNQVSHLKKKMNRWKHENSRSPALLLGDFNVPSHLPEKYRIFPVSSGKTGLFGLLEGIFPDAFVEHTPTVPTQEGLAKGVSTPAVKIDHALVSEHWWVNGAEFLPLRGSDHYPIVLSLDIQ